MDYAALQNLIADTLFRKDLGDVIPGFIEMAEEALDAELRVPESMEQHTLVLYQDDTADFPDDFLEPRLVALGKRRLDFVSLEDSLEVADEGDPQFFTTIGTRMKVLPSPGGGRVTLTYYKRIPRLTDQSPNNTFLKRYPSLYLYGSLIHSALYLREDERLSLWTGMYRSALDRANMRSERAQYGPTMRARVPSIG